MRATNACAGRRALDDEPGRRKIVGIDLGTTNSAIAHFDEYGKADVIANSDNERTTPSIVLFEEGEAIVGRVAKNLAVSNPERVVQFVKRRMGDPSWAREIDGHRFTPEVLSAMILKRLVQDAEMQLGQPITDVVITCPAYFNDNERRLTRDAGRIAGLNVLGILNESTAAALAYGLNNRDKDVTAVVFDLGGGTFDTTILSVNGNKVRVLATDGERRLGGKDWDDLLIEYVSKEFQLEHGVDPREDPEAYQDLILRAEEAKKSLSQKPRARIFIQCQGKSLKTTITREEFNELTAPLLAQAEACLGRVLQKAGVEWSDIDVVLPVGGSTRMPAVREMLERVSDRTPERWINPDECVALGATYWAAILMVREAKRLSEETADTSGEVRKLADQKLLLESAVPEDLIVVLSDTNVTNVNSHSLGVLSLAPDGAKTNRVMIKEQTPIPHKVTKEFVTAIDGQRTVEVRILEGDSRDPKKCVDIGRCVISDLPKGRKKGSKVKVTYRYREDGVVAVRAKDVQSGKTVKANIQPTAPRLSGEEAQFMGRKVADLLESQAHLDSSDSDERIFSEFAQGWGDDED